MSYVGDINLGDTIDVKFTTRQISGAPFTLAGSPVISAYVGNNTTEITAGITLTVDFDSRTGLNNVRVVATGGNGYATASNYQLVITTGTVNSVSVVGEVVAEFSIEARSAGLKPTVAGRTVVVDASGLVDANTVKVGPTGSGTAQTARDIGASVLLSAGSGAGQLDFTSGVVKANATQWLGGTIPAVNVTGVPLVDLKYTLGTISPATAGSVRADAVTAGVTVTTNNDKTAYTLSAAYDAAKTASQAGDAMSLTTAVRPGIRKNTALAGFEFVMTDSTTHQPVTGKTVTVVRSIDKGAFAAGTLSAVTELSNGIYYFDWGAGDLNGDVITLRATAAGSDDLFLTIRTNP